ncbi:MAG: homocysteine S-methyltransferase [Acidobacteriota bacterium]
MSIQLSDENPLSVFVRRQGVMVLDGGLATTLESRGCDLYDDLWSARILLEAPQVIRQTHFDFLAAGADCIATSSYQASLPGFRKHGLSEARGLKLLRQSVRLALDARDEFWRVPDHRRGRLRPLVAASIGPYGAFLADGSEYTGRYNLGDEDLYAFHRRRWHLLARSQADLLACETIPSHSEAEVLLRLLKETPETWAWMSFSCGDGAHLCDGSPLCEVARLCHAEPRVAGVGINCTSPELVADLIAQIRLSTDKPVLVYPNSGDQYDVASRTWVEKSPRMEWDEAVIRWARLGATGIGGCCRIGPAEIAAIRRHLVSLRGDAGLASRSSQIPKQGLAANQEDHERDNLVRRHPQVGFKEE